MDSAVIGGMYAEDLGSPRRDGVRARSRAPRSHLVVVRLAAMSWVTSCLNLVDAVWPPQLRCADPFPLLGEAWIMRWSLGGATRYIMLSQGADRCASAPLQ